jgi:hypothetical protein
VARDFRQDRLQLETGEEVFVFYAGQSEKYSPARFVVRLSVTSGTR